MINNECYLKAVVGSYFPINLFYKHFLIAIKAEKGKYRILGDLNDIFDIRVSNNIYDIKE